MDLGELRSAMEVNGARWSQLLADELDPDSVITQVDHDDGYRKDATVGIRFAQGLHHGTDHRSQICTALTSLGVEPPPIDVWDFGVEDRARGRDLPAVLTSWRHGLGTFARLLAHGNHGRPSPAPTDAG